MFKFTVHPDDGEPYEAVATSRDVAKWERGGKGRSLGNFADNPSMRDMYDLAFLTVDRLGLFDGDITQFRDGVDLEFEQDEDAVRPTPRAR